MACGRQRTTAWPVGDKPWTGPVIVVGSRLAASCRTRTADAAPSEIVRPTGKVCTVAVEAVKPCHRLGALLQELRVSRRLSVHQLTRISGLSRTTVSQALNGSGRISPETVARLAEALGADLPPLLKLLQDAEPRSTRSSGIQRSDVQRSGVRLSVLDDTFAIEHLEVHRAIDVPGAAAGVLPLFVPRTHDQELAALVAQGVRQSAMRVLVGGSSTGKTRSLAVLVQLLATQAEDWRLFHPRTADELLRALESGAVMPRTVLWLNELQRYLLSSEGEDVAAELSRLLADPEQGPVLVLGTLWPEHRQTLAFRPAPHEEDPNPLARALIEGRCVPVADRFSEAELLRVAEAESADPRLALARAHAGGDVTQFLAGGHELVARYRAAPPGARALIESAIDARRVGLGPLLRQSFLESAAPAYLTDRQWQLLADDWLVQAWAYVGQDCKGVPGPLSAHRPRPGEPPTAGPVRHLADYLEHHGRAEHRSSCPPLAFWEAALREELPDADLVTLGRAAQSRWLLRIATTLYAPPARADHPDALLGLARIHDYVGNEAEAEELYQRAAAAGSAGAVADQARRLGRHGDRSRLLQLMERAEELQDVAAMLTVAVQMTPAGGGGSGLADLRQELTDEATARGFTDVPAYLTALTATAWTAAGAEQLQHDARRRGIEGPYQYLSLLWSAARAPEARLLAYERGAEAGHPQALNDLADLHDEADNSEEAARCWRRAAEAGHPEAAASLAWHYSEQGDRDSAASWHARAARNDAVHLVHLADLRLNTHDRAGALQYCWEAARTGHVDLHLFHTRLGEKWYQELRYGFEPDGTPSPPW
ncbi:helix-turn-helix domain-containing protein [Kitasatospora sp. NPDC094011]|uniref:helix-turn-helix domain-containing protein n=1 Tax=Kitasatospora sp. NPDC094011 TaxID=3364090 RepID=UPI003802AF88